MTSLRRDLALRLSLLFVAAWLVALAGAGLVLKSRTDQIFDSALQETAERILPLAVLEIEATRFRRDHDDDDDDDDHPRAIRRDGQPAPHQEYLTYLVRDEHGQVLVYSHDADLAAFDDAAPQGISTRGNHRLYTRSTVDGDYTIQSAEPLSVRRAALLASLATMLLPLALAMPVAIFGIGWVVRRGLRPVQTLADTLGRRGADDLSPMPPMALKCEIEPIRAAANRLMARLAQALEAERAFASNAAHELRTPIAATLAQTQRLIRETAAGPAHDRALRVEVELKRMARLAEKLLQLARAEGGGVVGAPGDVVPILSALTDDLGRDLPRARLSLKLPDAPVRSRLDPDAFGILAGNLIENALRHSPPDTPVTVLLAGSGVLRVTNDSAAIAPETLARLTERFERGASLAHGSGLGLTIASAIAAQIGQSLRLTSPIAGGRGFTAEVNVAG